MPGSGTDHRATDDDLDDPRAQLDALKTAHVERRRTEATLRESEARFRSLADSAPVLIWATGTDARCTFVNKPWLDFTGRTLEQELGDGWADGVHPEDYARYLDTYLTAFAARRPFRMEYRLRRGDGEYRWLLDSGVPRFTPEGNFAGYIGSRVDITDRKRVDEERERLLAEAEAAQARLAFLAEASNVLASSLDYEATLASVARLTVPTLADYCIIDLIDDGGAVRRVATAHAEAAKRPLVDELRRFAADVANPASLATRAVATGRAQIAAVIDDDLLARTVDDPEHLALLRQLGPRSLLIAPLLARGRTRGVVWLVMTDARRRYTVADQALAEELARRAALAVDNALLYRAAQEAIQARDQFLSIASHELKTPVAVIKSSAQLLLRAHERGTLDERRLERFLRSLNTASDRLNTLTSDLLDVSRIRMGQLPLRLQLVDLAAYVQAVASRYRETLDPHYRLQEEPTEMPATVLIDPDRIEQVLVNLLDNAVKYTPIGGTIRLGQEPHEGGMIVRVEDKGIGLPPEAVESIFEPFNRAPNATDQQLPGLGLGLYICRSIAERHGGRIWAESPGEGRGTTMRLWLPLASPEDEGPRE